MSIARVRSGGWSSVVELFPRPGRRHDLDPPAPARAELVEDSRGIALGVGVSAAQEPRARLSADRRDREEPEPARVSPAVDPFAEPAEMPAPRRQRLERLLDRLVERGIDAAVVDRLGEYLTFGPAQEVARIRPLALAECWGARSRTGCRRLPARRTPGTARAALGSALPCLPHLMPGHRHARAIAEHAHCEACHLDFQLDFAKSIELIFRVHPEIRAGRSGHLLHRRTGPLATRAGSGPRRAHRSGSSWSWSCRRARTGCAVRSCRGRSTFRSSPPRRFAAGTSTSAAAPTPERPVAPCRGADPDPQ